MQLKLVSQSLLALAIIPSSWAAPIEGLEDNPFDLPLTWNPFGFLTDAIEIGTPPQKLVSFVDWTWVGQYVLSPLCQGGSQNTSACLAPDQAMFNQYNSTSFVNMSAQYDEINWNPNHFYFYKDLSAQIGSDILKVGPDASSRTVLQVADMHFNPGQAFPFGGVYGLSPAFDFDNVTTEGAFFQMWKSGGFRSPLTSFIYCYNGTGAPPRSVCNGADGIQTLGGIRAQNVKDKIHWYDNVLFPEVNAYDFIYGPPLINYWGLTMSTMRIGDEVQALNTSYEGRAAAIFDHASYGRGAPVSTSGYEKLIGLTGARPIQLSTAERPNNGNQSDYAVDCGKVSSFPTLTYGFQGNAKEWVIVPDNYVEKVNGTCILNVRTLGEGDFQVGNFGETFARDKLVIFDFQRLKVGLADLKW